MGATNAGADFRLFRGDTYRPCFKHQDSRHVHASHVAWQYILPRPSRPSRPSRQLQSSVSKKPSRESSSKVALWRRRSYEVLTSEVVASRNSGPEAPREWAPALAEL